VVHDVSKDAVQALAREGATGATSLDDFVGHLVRPPDYYQYDLDLADVAEVWLRGSVIASWLLDLTAAALAGDPGLERFPGRVSDSGEGRWTLDAAIDEAVPAHVLAAALFERFASRGEADFQDRLLSAMRYEFGGHVAPGAGT